MQDVTSAELAPLDLSHPLWTRLYGPYGIRDVAGQLGHLAARWDGRAAQHLFWEELHHQEDLYPVSYAALPWLDRIAPDHGAEREPVLEFWAQALFCARRQLGEGEPFAGLSLRAADHAHPWIAEDRRLGEGDMVLLAAQARWLAAEGDRLAGLCLAAVPAGLPLLAAHLAGGYAGWHGARDLPHAMRMWAEEEAEEVIRAEGAPRPADLEIAGRMAARLAEQAPELAAFLEDYVAAGR